MAIDFPRSTYTAAEGVSAESWPASPSNGDTQTNGAGDNFTFISARSLWVLDKDRTHTITDGATYSWDLEKWVAQSHIPFRYHGSKTSDPTGMSADNEGDLYYNSVENEMRVFNGTAWDQVTSIGNFNILTLSASSTAAPVGGTAAFNGTATRFQLSQTPNTAQQLLIALDGVIQEPHSGSAVPDNKDGFVVVGQDIIFGAAPAANTPFWGVQMGAAVNVGTPSNGAVTNVHVNASAAIAGTKISPDFGSQNIATTGTAGVGTNSPVRQLEVKVSETANYATDFQQAYNCLALRNDQDNKAVGLEFKIGTNGQAAIGAVETQDSATSLFFSTRDGNTRSEKMRLSNTGRLSIGLTGIKVGGAPGDKNGKVNILAADTGFAMQIRNDSSNGNGLFLRGGGDAATEFPLYVTAHDETSPILVCTGNKKIGMGTDSPDALLEISGVQNAGTTELFTVDRSDGTRLYTIEYAQGANSIELQNDNKNIRFKNQASLGESMCILNTGLIGMGTTAPVAPLHVHRAATAADETVRISQASSSSVIQRMLIGFTKDAADTNPAVSIGAVEIDAADRAAGFVIGTRSANNDTAPVDRCLINSMGEFKVNARQWVTPIGGAIHQFCFNANDSTFHNGNVASIIRGNRSNTPLFQGLSTDGGPTASATEKFEVFFNGDVTNANDSYGATSDAKLKENIVDAGSQWEDFKAVKFRKYNYKEDTGYETHTQLGVIAQELETVSPGLVVDKPDYDEEGNELGTVTKSVKYSVLTKKALVALQEAMARIETLESEIKALKEAQ